MKTSSPATGIGARLKDIGFLGLNACVKDSSMNQKRKKEVERREFLKAGLVTGVAAATGIPGVLFEFAEGKAIISRQAFFLVLGDTLIPSSESSPGFRTLEPYGITEELMKLLWSIPDEDIELFNRSSERLFGKTYLELGAREREAYLRGILQSNDKIGDADALEKLQTLLRLTRRRVMTLYYQNFPEHRVKRDAQGNFLPRPGDKHMVFNPNTRGLKTGWDTTGFGGPLSWEQEEERRRKFGPLWKAYEQKMHS